MIFQLEDTSCAAGLFEGWDESLIWSALQGVMGSVYVTDRQKPVSAMAALGDFIFLAGEPDRELVSYRPGENKPDFVIMVPRTEAWNRLIEERCGKHAKKVSRYAIKSEGDIFDREKLKQALLALPAGCELRLIDEELYHRCREEAWSRDFVAQYAGYESYRERGLGAVILKDGELVSGASSYSSYQGGIEIEIGTKEPFRRRGLAYICGARLILECLERGWYPKWDAANMNSVRLAEKLGYHFSHEYTAYEIKGEL